MPNQDDLFADLDLAEDISPEASIDEGLEGERIGDKEEGALTSAEEKILDEAQAIREAKADAVIAYETPVEEETPEMEEEAEEAASIPEQLTGVL